MKSKFLLALTLVTLLGLNPIARADDLPTPSTIQNRCAFILRKSVVYGAVIVGTLSLPTGYHNWNASLKGEQHLKFGIYLDAQNIFDRVLNPAEREIVLDPRRDPTTVKRIAGLLASKLNGDYVETHELLPEAREASSYFKGQSLERGQCRHKACVLVGLLNHIGIRAHEGHATLNDTGEGHTFVILPEYNLVVEPTWDSMSLTWHVVDLPLYEQILKGQNASRTFDEESMLSKAVELWFSGGAR